MSRKVRTRLVGASAPPVEECVRVWPQEWQEKQLRVARYYVARRRKIRSQDDTPAIVRAMSIGRAMLPVFLVVALIVGYLWFTDWAGSRGGNLNWDSAASSAPALPTPVGCEGTWLENEQVCLPPGWATPAPGTWAVGTPLPPLLGGP